MTVSARRALAERNGAAAIAPAVSVVHVETPRRLEVNDPGSAVAVLFVQEVQEVFSQVRPDYLAPMGSIFKVAKKHKLVAVIDGYDEDYWTLTKQDELLESGDIEGPFVVALYALTANGTKKACEFTLAWPDLRKVALVVPKKGRGKTDDLK